jgi:hypothetical protein
MKPKGLGAWLKQGSTWHVWGSAINPQYLSKKVRGKQCHQKTGSRRETQWKGCRGVCLPGMSSQQALVRKGIKGIGECWGRALQSQGGMGKRQERSDGMACLGKWPRTTGMWRMLATDVPESSQRPVVERRDAAGRISPGLNRLASNRLLTQVNRLEMQLLSS